MKRLLITITLLAIVLYSCQNLPRGNVCTNEKFMQKLKFQTAMHIWIMENPGEALATTFLGGVTALFEGIDQVDKIENELINRLTPIAETLHLDDVSKPKKLSEGKYQCSAIFDYKGKKIAVIYYLERFHSGKNVLYDIKVEDIKLVR